MSRSELYWQALVAHLSKPIPAALSLLRLGGLPEFACLRDQLRELLSLARSLRSAFGPKWDAGTVWDTCMQFFRSTNLCVLAALVVFLVDLYFSR